jgi:uncharacterized protein YbcI
VLTAIPDGMVALLKQFYGRGPTRAKSYYEDDLGGCVLRGGFSRVEQTLLEGGRGAAVIRQRMEFQELMRARFEAVIERATGRQVIGFMSGNQQHPDMMCEVFILAPTDLVDVGEIAASAAPWHLIDHRSDFPRQSTKTGDHPRGPDPRQSAAAAQGGCVAERSASL